MLCGVLHGDSQALSALPYAPGAAFWDARPLKHEVASLEPPVRAAESHVAAPLPDAIRVLVQVRGAVAGSESFERAVNTAVQGTHEPAICGALAGALAGGVHGLRGIPAATLDSLRRRDLLDQQLTRILERRARTLAAVTAATRSS